MIERAPLPTVEVEGSRHLVSRVNAAFCTLLGKSREELLGKSFAEIVPGGGECVPVLDGIYQTGEAATLAKEGDGDDQASSWLYAMWPALDPNERPVGVIIQLVALSPFRRNVTAINEALLLAGLRQQELADEAAKLNAQLQDEVVERKRVIEKLAVADRDKDEFMAMLAHELRNPLAPIKSAAQILRMVQSKNFAIVKAQEIIERQVDHLTKLVDDLLDVSRIERGKIQLRRERLNLTQAISRAVASCDHLLQAQGHTITLDLPPAPLLEIDGDPTRIDQIMVNLISNASKYTPSPGAIHIKAAREGNEAVIRVRDNGIGISPEMLQRIFEVFTQVEQSLDHSKGGLGLGLKLVKELVELHGGTVEATSEGLGRGSEIIVRLPALSATTDAVITAVKTPSVRSSALRILVVDDSPDNRTTMEMFLSMSGHTIELAEDGPEAVEKALYGRPDVAFVDIGLPKLDGYQVAKQIRRAPGGDEIVLIALSGYGQEDDKRKALEAGFDAHLTKPFDTDAVTKLLGDLDQFRRGRL